MSPYAGSHGFSHRHHIRPAALELGERAVFHIADEDGDVRHGVFEREGQSGYRGRRACKSMKIRQNVTPINPRPLTTDISAGWWSARPGPPPRRARTGKRVAPVNSAGTPSSSVDPQRGRLLNQGRSASPRQNCTRGRCSRRRSWPVRPPAPRPGSPPGSSAIRETSNSLCG